MPLPSGASCTQAGTSASPSMLTVSAVLRSSGRRKLTSTAACHPGEAAPRQGHGVILSALRAELYPSQLNAETPPQRLLTLLTKRITQRLLTLSTSSTFILREVLLRQTVRTGIVSVTMMTLMKTQMKMTHQRKVTQMKVTHQRRRKTRNIRSVTKRSATKISHLRRRIKICVIF